MDLFPVYSGVLGAAVGSFLALVADRLPRGQSVLAERSHCPACGRVLAWWELIPVLSYVALRGRCHGCGARIPLTLPLVELGAGLLFLAAALGYGMSVETAVVALYLSLLLVISLIDLQGRLILNRLVYPGAALAAVLAPFAPWAPSSALSAWGLAFLGGALALGLHLAVYLISRGGVGEGDVKLAGLVGLMTGFPGALVSLFVAFVVGGLVGLALLVLRLRGRKDVIPYGPYLSLGAAVALLFGPSATAWYLSLLS